MCELDFVEGKRPVKASLEREPKGMRVAVIGEAPGETEDLRGIPMIGVSGQLMRTVLRGYGYDDAEILFTNSVCCRPPANMTPTKEMVENSRSRVIAELNEFRPDRILAVGGIAAATILGWEGNSKDGRKITQIHSVWYKSPYIDCWVLPCVHPAFILRVPQWYPEFCKAVEAVGGEPYRFPEPTTILVRNSVEAAAAIGQYISLQGAEDDGIRAIDIETEGFNPLNRDLICLAISPNDKTSIVFTEEAVHDPVVLFELKKLSNDTRLTWVGHNAIQFDQRFIKGRVGIEFVVKYDTMLMHYATDERVGGHSLKTIAHVEFGLPDYEKPIQKHLDKIWGYRDAPRDLLYKYVAYDTAITHAAYYRIRPRMDDRLWSLYWTVFVPAARTLSEIKCYGILIDRPYLEQLGEEWIIEIEKYKKRMQEIAARFGYQGKFNPKLDEYDELKPASYKQLKHLMYELMALPKFNLKEVATSSGEHEENYESTADDVLNAILGVIERDPGRVYEREFIQCLKTWRRLAKLRSTYIVGLLEKLDETNRIYPDLLIHGTETGRLSSKNPNIQNIPKHDYEDRKKKGLPAYADQIRYAFMPTPGYKFVDVDYSQLEYRVCAWYCRDPGLIAAFNSGIDFHKAVASQIYNVPPDEVTKNQRHSAKFVNFGIMYGRQAPALAASELMWAYSDTVPCTIKQAQEFLDNFLRRFPKQEEFMRNIERQVADKRYVESFYGRRRRFPLITDKKAKLKFQREARNMPIQGMASDICLLSMVKIHNTLPHEDVRVLFPVHDAIVMEVKEDKLDEYIPRIIDIMQHPDLEDAGFPFAVKADVLERWALVDREE